MIVPAVTEKCSSALRQLADAFDGHAGRIDGSKLPQSSKTARRFCHAPNLLGITLELHGKPHTMGAQEMLLCPVARRYCGAKPSSSVATWHENGVRRQVSVLRGLGSINNSGRCSGKSQMNDQPIAVFDSGLGGLTVVRSLQQHLPNETLVYFGDTARVPYGTKTSKTVLQFAVQNCDFLLRFDPKLIIVACNTASALALDDLSRRMPVPLLGVVKPGADAAVARSEGRGIAVLATEATVSSEAYPRAIHSIDANIPVIQRQCPSLVPLIEEGRSSQDEILRRLLAEYLETIKRLEPAVVLLGCTHYPLVAQAVADLMPAAAVVDSADATAVAARQMLTEADALSARSGGGKLHCYVSDNPQRFREVGGRFLGRPICEVTWVSPEQFFHEHTLQPAK
jgi:glutamate racemase